VALPATAALSLNRLRAVLHYASDTGVFTWRTNIGGKAMGSVAGCVSPKGYLYISIDRITHKAHRLAWLYMTGVHPAKSLDHIDQDKLNNCWANLRELTHTENQQNKSRVTARSKSRLLGACYIPSRHGYRSQIQVDKKVHVLGHFDTAEEAHQVYLEAKRRMHPAWVE
jgi:hypothetical protein